MNSICRFLHLLSERRAPIKLSPERRQPVDLPGSGLWHPAPSSDPFWSTVIENVRPWRLSSVAKFRLATEINTIFLLRDKQKKKKSSGSSFWCEVGWRCRGVKRGSEELKLFLMNLVPEKKEQKPTELDMLKTAEPDCGSEEGQSDGRLQNWENNSCEL